MSEDTNPDAGETTIESTPDNPPAQATDILDAERKGLNDPEDAGPDHGDETPDDGGKFEEDEADEGDIPLDDPKTELQFPASSPNQGND